MKKIGRALLLAILGWQVRRLQARNHPKTIAVVGSYGKTSTKFAIAHVLSQHFRAQYQSGNYNDILTVPLIFFGETLPRLIDVVGWLRLVIRNERKLRKPYDFDVVVLELGIDGPNQMAAFGRYLQLDVAVVTAIAHEHMEFFSDLKTVAREELAVETFSKALLVNMDLCSAVYMEECKKPVISYGLNKSANYHIASSNSKDGKIKAAVHLKTGGQLTAEVPTSTKAYLYSACAAAAVANHFNMPTDKIASALGEVPQPSGRMQRLAGIKNSTILDETYNASPEATKAALDVLYDMPAPQKIALLGNMNELGEYSKQAHEEIGAYCDPQDLDLVITLGKDANQYVAPVAQERGCQAITTSSPYEAGRYIQEHIKDGAVVLVKGSQNGVFAEEAVKMILADPNDATKLVRQSAYWTKIKKKTWKNAAI